MGCRIWTPKLNACLEWEPISTDTRGDRDARPGQSGRKAGHTEVGGWIPGLPGTGINESSSLWTCHRTSRYTVFDTCNTEKMAQTVRVFKKPSKSEHALTRPHYCSSIWVKLPKSTPRVFTQAAGGVCTPGVWGTCWKGPWRMWTCITKGEGSAGSWLLLGPGWVQRVWTPSHLTRTTRNHPDTPYTKHIPWFYSTC